jgi:hypothetical protein
MKAKIISYSIKNQSVSVQNSLRKILIGHNAVSHGGKYKYRIDGILDKIKHIKPSRSTLITSLKDSNIILNILKEHNAIIKTYDIQINKEEFNK